MSVEAQVSARTFLFLLLLLALGLLVLIIRPFWSALFMAAVLAVTFHPWYERLTAKLNGHRKVAATLITLCLVIALVLPVVTLGVVAVREAAQALDSMHQILSEEGVDGLIHRVPQPIQDWIWRVWDQLPARQRNAQFIFNFEGRAAGEIPRLVGQIGQMFAQTLLMVVALFFMLLDGGRLLGWMNLVSPLQKRQMRELFTEFRRVSAIVLLGSVTTAGAQSAAALVGYLIAHAPGAYFLTLVTFFFALVPIVGAGAFSFAVAVFLYLQGHLYPAIFLAAWSVLVVGMVDNVVKPMVIKGGMEMHGAIVFFALIGGFAAFGLVGLVLGPLSVTLLLAVLRIYQRDFAARQSPAA